MHSHQMQADAFYNEKLFNGYRFRLLGRDRCRQVSRQWFGAFLRLKECGLSHAAAKRAADAEVKATFNPMLWLAIGQIIVKLAYAWWKQRHPED